MDPSCLQNLSAGDKKKNQRQNSHHYGREVMLMLYSYIFQGILGSVQSGKSALVHRYLTGSYMQEESPEGRVPAKSGLQIRANSVF